MDKTFNFKNPFFLIQSLHNKFPMTTTSTQIRATLTSCRFPQLSIRISAAMAAAAANRHNILIFIIYPPITPLYYTSSKRHNLSSSLYLLQNNIKKPPEIIKRGATHALRISRSFSMRLPASWREAIMGKVIRIDYADSSCPISKLPMRQWTWK